MLYDDDWKNTIFVCEFSMRNPYIPVVDRPSTIERLHNRPKIWRNFFKKISSFYLVIFLISIIDHSQRKENLLPMICDSSYLI
ncbi:putative ribosome-binding factor A, chloroplastic [Iris pallida]|uniref:Ribosome-binding factor A, chloroplastic n=1 Tax=Iris pallida TaxID=29817 RepID=A0AAX6GHX8_IRIPA|nr:putative ribosome-binding factor A, chloroplastic [Iris pallida]